MTALARALGAISSFTAAPCATAVLRSSATCSAAALQQGKMALVQAAPAASRIDSFPARHATAAPRYYSADAQHSSTSSKPRVQLPSYMLFHPTYDLAKIQHLEPCHRDPKGARDWASYGAVQIARRSFDLLTGYTPSSKLTTGGWLQRFIFLETVAGVPGMVGAMLRHMVSLRTMQRDHGWIHTLLEEAENERMHLLTFMKLREPGLAFRLAVLATQGVFFNAFLAAYIISPRTCHRFVGYLEEEAVKTYTHALHDIDSGGEAAVWATTPAPDIAITYWRLPDDATVRDVIAAVRADEACHSHVNHTLASMAPDQDNPFHTGHTDLPQNFVNPPDGFRPAYEPAADAGEGAGAAKASSDR